MIHTDEIKIIGSLEIGTRLDMQERITPSCDVDGIRFRQTLEHVLVESDQSVIFKDEGLTQGYIVFGQPGAGKTYFIRKTLAQLLALHEEDPERRYGGLIIDPKGDYPRFVSDALRKSKNRKAISPIIIFPGMQKPINILHCGLSPENLAKIISASVKALAKGADEYFTENLAVVLSSILVSGDIISRKSHRKAPSMKSLLQLLSGFNGENGQRTRNLQARIGYLEAVLQGKSKIQLTEAEQREIARCVDNLRAFLKEEKAYVVDQKFKQAFEAFENLDFLCGPADIDGPNIYDDIINSGRIVSVSIPPSETYARSVFTLMKNIFQKVVLSRFARYDENGAARMIKNIIRPVFLICDEYHLSASDSPECGVGDSTFLSLARAFACFSLFATQGLDQLKTSAIGDRWEAVIGLFRAKFFFTVGDNSTATLACDLAGEQPSLFVGSSLNQGGDGKSWGMSDQLTTKQHLPKYIVLRSLPRGHAAIVGSLDGVSKPDVRIIRT